MSQLTQAVKAKYPQYANVPDAQLEQAVLAKYPQYKPMAGKTVGGFIENVGKSGVNAVTGIGSALINTVNPNMEKNTIANLARLGVGTAQLLDPTEVLGTGQQDRARAVGKFYKDRYGSLDAIGNTLYNDPVGAALDVSTVLGGAGAVAKGLGTAGKIGGLTRAGEVLSTAASFTDPIALAGKGVGAVGKNVFSRVPSQLENASNTLLTRGIGQPKTLGKIEGIAGRPVGELMSDYNIFDRAPETVQAAIDAAGGKYDDAIRASGSNVSTGSFLKNLDKQIEKLKGQATLSETARAELQALLERRANIESYLTQNGAIPLQFSPNTAVEMKSQIYRDVNPSTFNPQYQGSGGQLAAKKAYQGLISSIDEVVPGTRQLGRDQSALIKLKGVVEDSAKRGDARQLVNFTKLGGAGVGGVLGGIPGAVMGYAAESIANNPKSLGIQSKILRGASKTIGSDGVRKAAGSTANVFSRGYSFGKSSRMTLPEAPKSPQQQTVKRTETQAQKSTNNSLSGIVPPSTTSITPTKKITAVKYESPKLSTGNNPFSNVKKVKKGSFY